MPYESYTAPLTPGVHKKVVHIKTNLQLSAAGLFKYVWRFCKQQVLKG